jgi:hypothetical protein
MFFLCLLCFEQISRSFVLSLSIGQTTYQIGTGTALSMQYSTFRYVMVFCSQRFLYPNTVSVEINFKKLGLGSPTITFVLKFLQQLLYLYLSSGGGGGGGGGAHLNF